MSQRIKGSEVAVVITSEDGVERSIDAVGSIEMTVQIELLTEGYLGEASNRRDDIFNGVEGSLELHLERGQFFQLIEKIKDRASRRTPGARFDLVAIFAFPNGDRVRGVVPDVYFGEIPVNTGGRGEYVTSTINWGASDVRFLGAA